MFVAVCESDPHFTPYQIGISVSINRPIQFIMRQILRMSLCALIVMIATNVSAQDPFVRYILSTGTIDDDGVTVVVSSDDAEQENDAIDALFDDDIDSGWEGEPEDQNILTAGMLFRGIWIPQGMTIDSAFIYVTSHEAKTTDDVARITIVGEAADSASTYDETNLIDARPQTSASILWEVNEEWGLWTEHRTPDLASIIQEIVNRPGWKSDNSINFLFLGEDQGPSDVENAREWESYENIADPEDGGDGQNHPERRPRIEIYFSGANSIERVYNELNVYPNPATELINIELVAPRAAFATLYNLNGQVVNTQSTEGNKLMTLSTADLNEGMYVLQVVQDEKVYTKKVMVSPR